MWVKSANAIKTTATVATTTISVLNSKLTQNIHTYIHISPTLKKKLPG